MTPEATTRALAEFLYDWLPARRWYAGKARTLIGLVPYDQAQISRDPPVELLLMQLVYAEGPNDTYALPLRCIPGGGFADALEERAYQQRLLQMLAEQARHGPFRFESYVPLSPADPRLLAVEQSNTSIAYGSSWVLKNIRRLALGVNRDLEVGRFLTQQTDFACTPEVAGAITYEGKATATLGVLQRFVPNTGDGWRWVLGQLEQPPNAPDDVYWSQDGLPERHSLLMADIERLGRVTGQMHHALASRPDVPDFAPEPCTEADRAAWLEDAQAQLGAAMGSPKVARADAGWRERVGQLASSLPLAGVCKIQVHGDYHLGQVLKTGDGFAVIDFEGEPARPIAERRAKQPALRDVAGMLRSLDYAEHTAGADGWASTAGAAFLRGWQETSGMALEPRLLRFFLLAKAFYELNYELNNRPTWVDVPLAGVQRLMTEP